MTSLWSAIYNLEMEARSSKPTLFCESWVRKCSVGTSPNKFSCWKFLGTECYTQKITFSLISVSRRKKNVAGSCALNFDAGDLPHSLLELSYPQVSKGRPEVDLVSTVCRPGPSKVRKPRFMYTKKGDSEVFFCKESIFLAKEPTFAYSMSHIFWKLLIWRFI